MKYGDTVRLTTRYDAPLTPPKGSIGEVTHRFDDGQVAVRFPGFDQELAYYEVDLEPVADLVSRAFVVMVEGRFLKSVGRWEGQHDTTSRLDCAKLFTVGTYEKALDVLEKRGLKPSVVEVIAAV